jgi:esterase FrsA
MIRVFSLTLPGHENNLPAKEAMSLWAQNIDCVDQFLSEAETAVAFALREGLVDPHKMAIGGLSRGGFIAAHLAAREDRFRFLLQFAPLTRLSKIKEFANLQDDPLTNSLDLIHLAPKLGNRNVRIYIGNHDTRVGTQEAFAFTMSLVAHKQNRTSHVEFMMSPSIGQAGHGTSPEIFKQGAEWISSLLQGK